MSKKHKIPQKMVVKLPETSNLDPEYKNPYTNTIDQIKYSVLHNRYTQLLIAFTFIGCFLRFLNLGSAPLWLDEASTVTFATAGSFWDIWQLTATIEPNPPLFHWVEYIMLFFGNNEFILRFIPALLGTITIPIMYFIGKEFIDENGGIIAAAAFAVSPFLIVYSQEARAYTMLLFFIALTFLFYLKALKSTNLTYWILFAIAGSLAFWTHLYAAIFVGSLILYTLVIYKLKNIKEVLISSAILAVTTIPLAIIVIPVILASKSGGPTFGIQGFGIIFETIVQLTGYSLYITYIMMLLFICGMTMLFLKDRNKGILITWLLVATFAVSLYLSYKIPMVPRYLIFLNIMLTLGIAASYKMLYAFTQQKSFVYVIIGMIIFLNLPFMMNYYTTPQKDDWRAFSGVLSSMTNTGDLIVTVPGYMDQPLNYYYSNKTDDTIEYRASNASMLDIIRGLQTGNTYYVVTGDINSADPSGGALNWLNQYTQKIYQKDNIYLFKS